MQTITPALEALLKSKLQVGTGGFNSRVEIGAPVGNGDGYGKFELGADSWLDISGSVADSAELLMKIVGASVSTDTRLDIIFGPSGYEHLALMPGAEPAQWGMVDAPTPPVMDGFPMVTDDDETPWHHVGVDWSPTPTTWQADFPYGVYRNGQWSGGALVVPTVPNGHVYAWYPFYGEFSDSSEPSWPTDGNYVSDYDGYWYDLGLDWTPETGSAWAAPVSAWLPSHDYGQDALDGGGATDDIVVFALDPDGRIHCNDIAGAGFPTAATPRNWYAEPDFSVGAWLRIRSEVAGPLLSANIWTVGTTEPISFLTGAELTGTDSGDFQPEFAFTDGLGTDELRFSDMRAWVDDVEVGDPLDSFQRPSQAGFGEASSGGLTWTDDDDQLATIVGNTFSSTTLRPIRIGIDKSLQLVSDQAVLDFTNEDLSLGWGESSVFVPGKQCRIFQWFGDEDNAVQTFTGLIDQHRDTRDPLGVSVTVRDRMSLAVDETFSSIGPQGADEEDTVRTEENGVYLNREVSYIVNDILDRIGWPDDARDVHETSYVLDEYIVSDGASWAEELIGEDRLTGLVQFGAWADELGVFHFAPVRTNTATDTDTAEVPAYTFESGVDILTLEDDTDLYDLKTRVKVRGPFVTTVLKDVWTEQWRTGKIKRPVGIWYDPTDSANIRVVCRSTKRLYKIRQSDRVILSSVYLGSQIPYPLGITGDPSDSSVYWVLNCPWPYTGSTSGNSVKKVQKSNNQVLTSISIPNGRWSAIKMSAAFMWLTNLDTEKFYKRNKVSAAAIDDYRHTYSSTLQSNPSGIMIDGTTLHVFWNNSGTTARFLICDESAPLTITRVIRTSGTTLHGGEMDTTTHTECWGDADTSSLVAKFTLVEPVETSTDVATEVIDSDLEDELGELAGTEPRVHDAHSGDPAHSWSSRRHTIDLEVITSLAQATDTARLWLDRLGQPKRILDGGIIANPALQKTDLVALVDPVTGVSEAFVIDTYRTTMEAGGTYLGTLALVPAGDIALDDVTDEGEVIP